MIHVGTSGYNYPEWKGSFYPVGLSASKMLPYYAARFTAVEINYTFYRMPTAKAVAGWAAATPPAFVFALKAPQRITHHRRLKDVDEPLTYFRDVARSLGPQLGPLLFQLPPNFRKETTRLADLLGMLPRDLRVAFEFRHHSWFDDDVFALLRAWNGALCVADTEKGTTPLVSTADFGYLRLRDQDYTDAELADWAARLRSQAGATPMCSSSTRSPAPAPRSRNGCAMPWELAPLHVEVARGLHREMWERVTVTTF